MIVSSIIVLSLSLYSSIHSHYSFISESIIYGRICVHWLAFKLNEIICLKIPQNQCSSSRMKDFIWRSVRKVKLRNNSAARTLVKWIDCSFASLHCVCCALVCKSLRLLLNLCMETHSRFSVKRERITNSIVSSCFIFSVRDATWNPLRRRRQ